MRSFPQQRFYSYMQYRSVSCMFLLESELDGNSKSPLEFLSSKIVAMESVGAWMKN